VGVYSAESVQRSETKTHVASRCSERGSIAGFLMSLLCFENWQEQFTFEVLYIDICYSVQLSLAFLLHIWEVPVLA